MLAKASAKLTTKTMPLSLPAAGLPHSIATRDQALDRALVDIEKHYGKGAIMRLGQSSTRFQVESIPTGSIALDLALGVGGVPRGRVVEIYGPESSGKTTLASHIMAEAQRMGGAAAFIDAEHAFDPDFAQRICGVTIPDLLISQPDSGEQALQICELLVQSSAIDVIVVDSVAALTPKAEIEGDMGDSLPGAPTSSSRAPTSSAPAPKSPSARTRSPHPSKPASSTSCSTKVSPAAPASSTSVPR